MKVFVVTTHYIEDGACIAAADSEEEALLLFGKENTGLDEWRAEELLGVSAEGPARVLNFGKR